MTATRRRLASPTPDCLRPREVQQFVAFNELREDRKQHADKCSWCGAWLEAARVDEQRLAVFAETASRVWGVAMAPASTPSASPKRTRLRPQRRHRIDA